MESIAKMVRGFIVNESLASQQEVDTLSDNVDLKQSGFLDSLATLKLIAFLEANYDIEIQIDERNHLSSIAGIVRLISERTSETPGSP